MSVIVRIGVLGALAGGPLLGLAQAQQNYYSRDKYEAVTDRSQPEFDPTAVRVGTFLVNANAQASVALTDNVFASNTNTQSDTIVRVGTAVAGQTDWSNHEVGFRVSAFRNEFLDTNSESNTDLRGSLRGRLDVTRQFSVSANVFAEDLTEARTNFANGANIDGPVEFQRTGFGFGANYQADRIRWENSVRVVEADYEDSTTTNFDLDFRDRSVVSGRSRLSYAISPDLAVFGQGTYSSSDYDIPQIVSFTPPGGVPVLVQRVRDSDTYTVAGGINFELQTLIRGDIAVGYLTEDRKDANLSDVNSLSVDGRLQWFPSRLTTVTFRGGRQVQDFGLVESSTALQTNASVRVDHELRRNIILSAFGRIDDNNYKDIDRDDSVTAFGVEGRYKMNRHIHFDAFARHTNRDVSGVDVSGNPNFDVTVVGVGIRIFP